MQNFTCAVSLVCCLLGCGSEIADDVSNVIEHESAGTRDEHTPPLTESTSALELLDRAIVAYGGDSAWEKLKTCKVTYRTAYSIANAEKESGDDTVIIEDYFSYPDRCRRTVRRESDGEQVLFCVVNGDRMWIKPLEKDAVTLPCDPDVALPAVIGGLDRLLGIRQSNQTITLGDSERSDDGELVPLTIWEKGQHVSTLVFDSSNHLVVKVVKYVPDASDPPASLERTVLTETTYNEYKSIGGVILPTRIVVFQRGRKAFETTIQDVEFPSELDSQMFDIPP